MKNFNYYFDIYLLKNQGVKVAKLCEIYGRSKSWITYVLRQADYYFVYNIFHARLELLP